MNGQASPATRGHTRGLTEIAPPLLFGEATGRTAGGGVASDDDEAPDPGEAKIAWSEQAIVQLHAVLFDTCVDKLADPKTPLDEVIDCLRWIFSEPQKEGNAFSFTHTLRLYARPPADRVRGAVQVGLKRYVEARLAQYPSWVAEAFWSDPDRFADELERNPQWVNATLRKRTKLGDLFAT